MSSNEIMSSNNPAIAKIAATACVFLRKISRSDLIFDPLLLKVLVFTGNNQKPCVRKPASMHTDQRVSFKQHVRGVSSCWLDGLNGLDFRAFNIRSRNLKSFSNCLGL